MRRSGQGSGGGLGMNKVVHRQAPKVEPKANAINPSWVAQRGALVGNHATNTRGSTGYTGAERSAGRGYAAPYGITDPVKAVGVGGGRTIYKTGTQCQTGSADPGSPRPQGRGILTNE